MRRCLPKPTYITNKLSRRPRGPHNYGDPEPGPRYTRSGSNPNPNVQFLAHNLRGKRKIAFQLDPGMGVSLNCDCQGRGIGRGAVFSSIHRRRTTSVLCFGGAMANENSKIIAAAEGASRIPEARSQSQSQHH